jgi:copper transport protein
VIGVIALVRSELFIGHTASTEPRWLVVASGAMHLLAGGLWVAGVAMLAATLWRRHRRGAELEAALLATRFSVAAIGSVVAVSVTGVALGVAILGDVGALTSTEFGRLLLVKIMLVIVLVALGAYNQRVVMPALERRRRARRGGHRLRRVVTAEVVVFLAVIAVTAALVGADSTG